MDYRVYTVTNRTVLLTGNQSLWGYDERAKINPATNFPYMDGETHLIFLSLIFPSLILTGLAIFSRSSILLMEDPIPACTQKIFVLVGLSLITAPRGIMSKS